MGLRNIFYPYLIWAFYKEWQNETAACGSPWNPILITPLLQVRRRKVDLSRGGGLVRTGMGVEGVGVVL